MPRRRRRFYSNPKFKYAALATGLGLLVFLILELTNTVDLFNKTETPAIVTQPNTEQPEINNPPAEDPSDPTEAAKNPTKNSGQTSGGSNSSGKKKVTPQIVFAGQNGHGQPLTVRGFVDGILEEGGTCTATAAQGSKTVSATSVGFGNVSYTTCPQISIPRSSFGPGGTWYVKLKYSSNKSAGTSSQEAVAIQ